MFFTSYLNNSNGAVTQYLYSENWERNFWTFDIYLRFYPSKRIDPAYSFFVHIQRAVNTAFAVFAFRELGVHASCVI